MVSGNLSHPAMSEYQRIAANSFAIIGRAIGEYLTAAAFLRELLRFRALQLALVGPFLRSDVDLPRTRDLLLLVEQHLLPLRQPAGHAADGEQNGEEVGREGHRTVDEAGVEVDVRIELSRGEV